MAASSALLLALASLSSPELVEPLASQGDLALLALAARIAALVVPAEEQNDLGSVRVAEDPKQHSFLLALLGIRRLGEHALDLGGGMSDSELEEAFSKLLPPLGPADVNPPVTENVLQSGHERSQLDVGQVGFHPLLDRAAAVIILEELDRELAGTHPEDGSGEAEVQPLTSCPRLGSRLGNAAVIRKL